MEPNDVPYSQPRTRLGISAFMIRNSCIHDFFFPHPGGFQSMLPGYSSLQEKQNLRNLCGSEHRGVIRPGWMEETVLYVL